MITITALLMACVAAVVVAVNLSLKNAGLRGEISFLKESNSELHSKLSTRNEHKLPQPFEWNVDLLLSLRKFLTSDTGVVLMGKARGMEFNVAIQNAKQGTPFAAGVTTGISEAFNWIQSLASDEMFEKLSRPSGESDGNKNTAVEDIGDPDLVERYSP